MKKKWWIIILILIIVVLAGVFFMQERPVTVSEVKIQSKVIKKTVSANGIVKAVKSADLAFANSGRVTYIGATKGKEVSAGTLLAGIYNMPLNNSIQSVKDLRDVALRNLDMHIQQRESNIDILGGETEYDIETRKLQELISKSEADYQSTLSTLPNTYIYAPFTGTIIDSSYEVGEIATAGSTAVKLADLTDLVFEIELDQEDFGLLKPMQKVDITLDSFDNTTFNGEVMEIPYFADGTQGDTFVVKVKITDERKKDILLGMTGDAYIILLTTENEVPALTFDDVYYDIEDKPYVFVIENDHIKKQYLEIGLEGDIYTEIKTEINLPIVASSVDDVDLKEGQKAKILE